MIEDEMKYFLDRFLLGCTERKRKMNYEPLKITFHLSSPICLTSPWMFFDSLVGHIMLKQVLKEDYYLLPIKFPFSRMLERVELPPQPIKQTGKLFHSSISFFDTDRKALDVIYKKFEDRWIGGNKKISRASGFYRDYMIQSIYFPARKVFFYVNGDYEELEKICKNITNLGDNTRIGWGFVRRFEIERTEKDYSLIKDGKAMRPIPISMLKKAEETISLPWKPPYWAPENVSLCAVPGSNVVL